METIILIIILLVLAAIVAIRYEPKFDLVVSNNRFILLLWYNKYDDNNIKKRVYKKLF